MARNKSIEDETLSQSFNAKDFKRIGVYIKPYQKAILKTLAVILLANVLTMFGPYFTKVAIDTAIPNHDYRLLIGGSIAFLISLLIIAWCLWYRIESITEIGQNVLKDMRTDIFVHLQKLSFNYFDNRPHGKILIRVVNYINTLSDLLSNGLINLISDVFNVLVTLLFMLLLDVRLTLYSLLLLPFLIILVLMIQKYQRAAYQALSNKQSNLNAYIHENIQGVKVTQSYAREEAALETFNQVSTQYRQSYIRAVKVQNLMWPAVANIATMTSALIYFVGVRHIGVQVSTGTLIAFVAYVSNFWNPVINIGNFYNSLITASAYLERIFETLDIKPEITDKENAFILPPIHGDVQFKHVDFQYSSNGPLILKDLNAHIKPGESIALVGPTGAGKSTIINLLSRFYDVSAGEVLIDGINVKDVTLNSLRQQVGVMLQDTFIFSGTILENIRYGRLNATDEEVIQAAKVVRADAFISQLKEGYQTPLQEHGAGLSVGQRQLLAFARTLLANPRILILDEATSSIDTETEALLQAGLEELLTQRTSFIVAHRLSTIKNSDRIFYIDHGQIVESGSHDELLAKKGAYYQLYQAQYRLLQAAVE